jgi:hypothetical protein
MAAALICCRLLARWTAHRSCSVQWGFTS